MNHETQTYNTIRVFGVEGAGGDGREEGGVTQYSILNNLPLNHETQTYNTIRVFGVEGAGGDGMEEGGSLNTQ